MMSTATHIEMQSLQLSLGEESAAASWSCHMQNSNKILHSQGARHLVSCSTNHDACCEHCLGASRQFSGPFQGNKHRLLLLCMTTLHAFCAASTTLLRGLGVWGVLPGVSFVLLSLTAHTMLTTHHLLCACHGQSVAPAFGAP